MKHITHVFTLVLFFLGTGLWTATVQAATGNDTTVANSAVKTVVVDRLTNHGLMQKGNINVTVAHNAITLTGTVPTLYAKRKAQEYATDVGEGYTIVNDLRVDAGYNPDSQINLEVADKIHKNLFYTIFDWVQVQTSDGAVTLTGWVHEPWLKTQFEHQAERVPGVTKVNDKIEQSFGPGSIGIRAARLIYNDPLFEPYAYMQNPPIHIIVNNGQVILEGSVSSENLKSWAYNILEFRTNAARVIDNLKVASK